MWDPNRFAVHPSGDVAQGVPLERQPPTVGQMTVATMMGSLLAWTAVAVVAITLAPGSNNNPAGPLPNPFARFRSFSDCERQARRRGVRDPGAYCGAIKRRTEG
jgi:hypothetical protein